MPSDLRKVHQYNDKVVIGVYRFDWKIGQNQSE